ncbi:MAG: gliding motility lipoprotein GldH [Prevotellaceae bacterium]|jgi:gliding motility-associated lipoprotein GldH|nr:gliding motility lipoprotein GldH [Prevotellaceae bacterium]
MKTILQNTIGLLAIACMWTACDKGCVADAQRFIHPDGWHKDSIATMSLLLTDTVHYCDVILTLRHDDDYPYSNLILSVTATAPSGVTACDTVEYRLTGEQEVWTGKKGGRWIDARLGFRRHVHFTQSGLYTFAIAHLMRNETLPSVGAVGVRIEQRD